ncbi:ACT domain-containing protein [Erwinia sp. CPCC 100877]|nr:ACT domain-containing protein [Erwinia sp. CPCC 100877]
MQLQVIDEVDYMIAKFPASYKIPASFETIQQFKSITYTHEECSIVAPVDTLDVSQALAVVRDWFIIQIVGELDFSLVGVLAQLANPLAENQISIFALSTYNTDYLLLQNKYKKKALHVLKEQGHQFV